LDGRALGDTIAKTIETGEHLDYIRIEFGERIYRIEVIVSPLYGLGKTGTRDHSNLALLVEPAPT
jgi:hypothetical protein